VSIRVSLQQGKLIEVAVSPVLSQRRFPNTILFCYSHSELRTGEDQSIGALMKAAVVRAEADLKEFANELATAQALGDIVYVC
jgi:hypothetical protein